MRALSVRVFWGGGGDESWRRKEQGWLQGAQKEEKKGRREGDAPCGLRAPLFPPPCLPLPSSPPRLSLLILFFLPHHPSPRWEARPLFLLVAIVRALGRTPPNYYTPPPPRGPTTAALLSSTIFSQGSDDVMGQPAAGGMRAGRARARPPREGAVHAHGPHASPRLPAGPSHRQNPEKKSSSSKAQPLLGRVVVVVCSNLVACAPKRARSPPAKKEGALPSAAMDDGAKKRESAEKGEEERREGGGREGERGARAGHKVRPLPASLSSPPFVRLAANPALFFSTTHLPHPPKKHARSKPA